MSFEPGDEVRIAVYDGTAMASQCGWVQSVDGDVATVSHDGMVSRWKTSDLKHVPMEDSIKNQLLALVLRVAILEEILNLPNLP